MQTAGEFATLGEDDSTDDVEPDAEGSSSGDDRPLEPKTSFVPPGDDEAYSDDGDSADRLFAAAVGQSGRRGTSPPRLNEDDTVE